MKTARTAIVATAAWAASAANALAATGTRVDHSGLLVWAFLGMCALIVVAQLVPAALMLVGIVKGIVSAKEPATEPARK